MSWGLNHQRRITFIRNNPRSTANTMIDEQTVVQLVGLFVSIVITRAAHFKAG